MFPLFFLPSPFLLLVLFALGALNETNFVVGPFPLIFHGFSLVIQLTYPLSTNSRIFQGCHFLKNNPILSTVFSQCIDILQNKMDFLLFVNNLIF